jgi:hypothetical protein
VHVGPLRMQALLMNVGAWSAGHVLPLDTPVSMVSAAQCCRPSLQMPSVCAQATYPLDTLRLRLAVDPASRSITGAAAALMREGSHRAFFRGLGASMLGAAPPLNIQSVRGLVSPRVHKLPG